MKLKNLIGPASNGTKTYAGIWTVLTMLPLLAAGIGAGLAEPKHANESWNANTRIAQGQGYGEFQICRDIFNRPGEFVPKHPKADQYGCVHPRYLGGGRRQADPHRFQLRRSKDASVRRWASQWVPVNNSTSHIVRFLHDFKRPPSAVMIWFSPNRDRKRMYPVLWSQKANANNNPISVDLGQNGIRLHIRAKRPLHRRWNARTGKWQQHDRGFWKVIILE